MRRVLAAASSLLGAAVILGGCATFTGDGWVTLIDGDKGLENWNKIGDANWRAEGGAIVADKGQGGFLVTKTPYRDFEIRAEFWAESNTNSGIFIRCANPAKVTAADCYEVNVWDTRPDPKYATGAIVDHASVPVPILYKAGGRWNTLEITARGSSLVVKFNGVTTVDIRDSKRSSGEFGLQFANLGPKGPAGDVIRWRKVQVRTL